MKELHNHIFSNTTCISKETMLRYINKQLSKNELYEVEKHMLDCELCTDAYDGIQFAKNSSMLFAIDNQIDQRVGGGNSKAPIIRNLMVAASILVIVFGAYFTFDYFNTAVNNGSGLAINEIDESKQDIPLGEKSFLEEEVNNQANTASKEGKLLDMLEDAEESVQNENFRTVVNVPEGTVTEQEPKVNNAFGYNMGDEIEEIEDEEDVIVTAKVTRERANKAKGESEQQLESLDDAKEKDLDNRRKDNFDGPIRAESNSSSNLSGAVVSEPILDKSGEALKKEVKKSKNRTRNTSGKKRYKSVAQSPGYSKSESIQQPMESEDRAQRKTVTIDSYKVVDYTEEYQVQYDLKNVNSIETKSVSADYESKLDEDEVEKQKKELTIEVTYKETLEKAIKLYKDKNYTQAIEQFDLILMEHPDEVNGLFYGGLSNYHLKRYNDADKKLGKVLTNKETSFNEEANWYKALTLIELKQTEKAKKLLNEIVTVNGFYKTAAVEKLKELN